VPQEPAEAHKKSAEQDSILDAQKQQQVAFYTREREMAEE
jgi:hypothetical protein